jgi:DeoR/GlpR family transcriptional regulator of sugar metabolism
VPERAEHEVPERAEHGLPEEESAQLHRPALAETRRAEIAAMLRDAGSVTVSELEARFGISAMTARRDLGDLERRGFARRTHGGAVLPSVATHEDSFARRVETATAAKAALAEEALAMLAPSQTVFLDSSTSAFYLARQIIDDGIDVTVITNSVPIMDLIASTGAPNVELVGVGGTLRKLTMSYVGPYAVRTVLGHFADRAFFSVKGITGDGVMTDPDELEAEVKRSMLSHAQDTVLLVDDSKLSVRGFSVIGRVDELSHVLAYGLTPEHLGDLEASGVDLRVIGP